MTDTAPRIDELDDVQDDVDEGATGRSTTGKLTIYHAPAIKRPPTPEQVADVDLSKAADGFDYSSMLDRHDEAEVRGSLTEMVRAIAPGSAVTPLFFQEGMKGMSLVHAWF